MPNESTADLILVNADNYVRATTSRQFAITQKMTRGLDRFTHGRQPTQLDKQQVERMNRDTIYSSALVDISAGATLTLPDAQGRYLSVAVINEDNYTTSIFHGAGTYDLSVEEHGTPHVMLVARTLVDATDEADLAVANELQDQLRFDAVSSRPYERPNYDPDTYAATHELLKELGKGLTGASGGNGRPDEVDPVRHLLLSAYGWGGLPDYEVMYEANAARLPIVDQQLTVRDVPVDSFWSISIYNSDGFFEQNPYESYSTNSVIADANDDGSFTLHFGQEPNGRPNFLYVMEGWSYNVRLYQPRREVLEGEWTFPVPESTQ